MRLPRASSASDLVGAIHLGACGSADLPITINSLHRGSPAPEDNRWSLEQAAYSATDVPKYPFRSHLTTRPPLPSINNVMVSIFSYFTLHVRGI